MKIKTSELKGHALNYAAAIAAGFTYTMRPVSCETVYAHPSGEYHFGYGWSPSTNWLQGGPIIEREIVELVRCQSNNGPIFWEARAGMEDEPGHAIAYGPTPLIAAMRCYAARKLGDEVDVPEELL